MHIEGKSWRTIWFEAGTQRVGIIDQTQLPHRFAVCHIETVEQMAHAIATMQVRGAPLIGVAAAYGLALAMLRDASDSSLHTAYHALLSTRPTAVNLQWALLRMKEQLVAQAPAARAKAALVEAALMADEDVAVNKSIGAHTLPIIENAARTHPHRPVEILTHCNAGWLATVDHGTATAGIYLAHDKGIPVRVWVDETRPRNQGASLTAWELAQHGVPHIVIVDNAGGHLMQHHRVDMVIVGTDRTTANGDVCNKIGTYLKALAAYDNGIPFYVAAPSSSIDLALDDGLRQIPIEERAADEVAYVTGALDSGETTRVRVVPHGSAVSNPAFDVTPARLVTALITEKGICAPSREAIRALLPSPR